MTRRLLFGAGAAARRFLDEALAWGEVVAFCDNDPRKWGSRLHGLPVVAPDEIGSLAWDEVVISCTSTYPVYRQLLDLGVPEDRIRAPLLSGSNRRRWSSLRDQHRGERIFIIGNGPSLSLADLDLLHARRELGFAFNKIYLAFDRTPFRPTYYLVEDDLVARNCRDRIRQLRGFTKFFPDFLLPTLGPPDDECVLFSFHVQPPGRFEPAFSLEPLLVHSGYTCTYSALQLALWMGCNRIILIGVDFHFALAPTDAEGRHVDHGERNHFLPEYRQNGERWNAPYLEQTRRAYELARSVASERNVEILNATRGGKLEVFPRVPFDELF